MDQDQPLLHAIARLLRRLGVSHITKERCQEACRLAGGKTCADQGQNWRQVLFTIKATNLSQRLHAPRGTIGVRPGNLTQKLYVPRDGRCCLVQPCGKRGAYHREQKPKDVSTIRLTFLTIRHFRIAILVNVQHELELPSLAEMRRNPREIVSLTD